MSDLESRVRALESGQLHITETLQERVAVLKQLNLEVNQDTCRKVEFGTPPLDYHETPKQAAQRKQKSVVANAEDIEATIAEAQVVAGQGTWQPMSTAPKDGTLVILFYEASSDGIYIANCNEGEEWSMTPELWMPLPTNTPGM